MTKEELADLLNGQDFRYALKQDIMKQARANGLIIICGDSDDLTLVRGARTAEFVTWPGRCFLLDYEGAFPLPEHEAPEHQALNMHCFQAAKKVVSIWANSTIECKVLPNAAIFRVGICFIFFLNQGIFFFRYPEFDLYCSFPAIHSDAPFRLKSQ